MEQIFTTGAPAAIGPYSQALVHGGLVFTSGQIPLDPKTGELVGRLATEWEWVDGTHLRLKLREGVKFHDGSDFNADDVLFTLQRISVGSATAPRTRASP